MTTDSARRRASRLRLIVPAIALVAGLAACANGAAAGSPSGTASAGGTVAVVASTNVYGDLAATVGGSAVSVTSIISDPSADPHSYQASAQTQLALSKAVLVIENGGGYDDFVDTMVGALPHRPPVIDAVQVSGKTATAGQPLNEHVWYDVPSMVLVVQQISTSLQQLDPAHASLFAANAAALTTQLHGLESSLSGLKAAHAGEGVEITEPVPLYLLDAAGLVNRTPAEFSAAIEDETDVSPAVLQQTLQLFSSHAVAALVYNAQTTGAQTQQVIDAAKRADVPTVPVTETLPAGDTYVTWMQSNVAALNQALSR